MFTVVGAIVVAVAVVMVVVVVVEILLLLLLLVAVVILLEYFAFLVLYFCLCCGTSIFVVIGFASAMFLNQVSVIFVIACVFFMFHPFIGVLEFPAAGKRSRILLPTGVRTIGCCT